MRLPLNTQLWVCLTIGLLVIWPQAVRAQGVGVLLETLRMDAVLSQLRAEGLEYAGSVEDEMLDGRGGGLWDARVNAIYDTDTMRGDLERALLDGMTAQERSEVQTYFATQTGQRILGLEISARIAMADPEIEALAAQAYAAAQQDNTARLGQIRDFIAANNLMDLNVASAMSSNLEFYRGLSEGAGSAQGRDRMLAQVWEQEEAIRMETDIWLHSFLLMAYRPLSEAILHEYTGFSRSGPGAAFNAALFAGFDKMYRKISYELGRTAALALQGSDI